MSFDLSLLEEYGIHNDPEKEIANLQKTFENCIKENGPESYNTMLVIYNVDSDPMFALEARPYTSKQDMYTCYAEMLYSFRALEGHSFMMSNDVVLSTHESTGEPIIKQDSLILSFASRSSSCVVIMPYVIDKDNNVIWQHDEFNIASMMGSEDASALDSTGVLVELFYIMSHVKQSPFPFNTLVNYYSFRDFPYTLPPSMIGEKLLVKL
jgi:hypothetical protein